jgi:uncharacterized protein YuzE
MPEKPTYEFDPGANAGYITAPFSEAVHSNSQIRLGNIIVDLTDRGTISGVEHMMSLIRKADTALL